LRTESETVLTFPRCVRYEADKSTFEVIGDKTATLKLEAYYRRLGFRKLRNLLYFDNSLRMALLTGRQRRSRRN
jgi:hypothetical protein